MEKKYRFLNHTADAKFQAFGRTLEEAFSNAALATASLMWDVGAVARTVKRRVCVEGRDLEQLLLHFLEEVIYAFETQSFLLASVEEMRIKAGTGGGFWLRAVFVGDDEPSKHRLHGEVKAVTYNEMKIEQADSVTVQVVVDM